MRWTIQKKPKIGDTRWVTKFFWFPYCFGDVWIWFEFGKVYQEYVESYIYDFGMAIPNNHWEDQNLAL